MNAFELWPGADSSGWSIAEALRRFRSRRGREMCQDEAEEELEIGVELKPIPENYEPRNGEETLEVLAYGNSGKERFLVIRKGSS